jgi:hypothetical protein
MGDFTMKHHVWIGAIILLLSFTIVYSIATQPPSVIATKACPDPFVNSPKLQFQPTLWTATQLAHYISPAILDPTSGLQTNFCKHSVDYTEIISGGPPPDGIPPLDDPTFESIAKADQWLIDGQPVIAVALGKVAKAYPLAILTRHEIANDIINGVPIVVTFCPLCNAAMVFKRTVNGQILRFGVSGQLRHSDLIMWDNQTLSWWQQFTGEAIVGDLTGTQLELLPSQLVSWQDFKTAYPQGRVLSPQGRSYGINPYVNYDSTEQPFLYSGTLDSRLPATARVLGYFSNTTAIAYPLTEIAKAKVIQTTLDGRAVVIFYAPGQISVLDKRIIADSKVVGSATMFSAKVKGRQLSFTHRHQAIIDNETGSQWNVFGQAIKGKLTGTQLDPVRRSHVNFWFAWAAFRPATQIYQAPSR